MLSDAKLGHFEVITPQQYNAQWVSVGPKLNIKKLDKL